MVMVDELRVWPTRIACFKQGSAHLTADTLDELHYFAAILGLRREWFQPRSSPHYDLTISNLNRALDMGAVFVPARQQAKKRVDKREAMGKRT